eukprot:TRINITY_DN5243_c0_g1_i19.p2 TRINITY_DN5243_c0_g1~~TRINITY_DN5243_c0_g1_i19.p2  ORF type:complete len:100 (+),score=20.29 TRINITY_DN5243_c0_g1_i19:77-376(+)
MCHIYILLLIVFFFFFFKQKTAYEMLRSLVGSEMCIRDRYLGLEGGPPMFRQDFTCPALLEDLCAFYPYGAITHLGRPFQIVPVLTHRPLAWSPFARHY